MCFWYWLARLFWLACYSVGWLIWWAIIVPAYWILWCLFKLVVLWAKWAKAMVRR